MSSHDTAAGAPTPAETGIVLQARLGNDAPSMLERMLKEFGIQEVPFGDRMTSAVARLAGEPLIHVGEDSRQRDISSA